ncbi:MAG TPA: hypothetical protein VFG20_02005 [Planctomycetaceae bacterium]|nr:hypothetical protein [Planctomycetaceae bacterium]
MLRPLLIIAAMMVFTGIATYSVTRHVARTSANGRPFDWLGDRVRCQKCQGNGARAGSGYWYHCPLCQAEYRARWDDETKTVELDW